MQIRVAHDGKGEGDHEVYDYEVYDYEVHDHEVYGYLAVLQSTLTSLYGVPLG